ncbi:hypothetical protein FB563_0496 [Streptomyces puniciscabiei]|uniref:Uncharacterized protein n=1 Tax=Streptomyces puniciscabiei TaxID=164348 RepID=A0A542U918_9ACTN|nr:hypothetical protein [Streptomyces puniciscabiei]TQK95580.1 hypothetical protein FB563_0496 [Streptomyces puniciscabiei]
MDKSRHIFSGAGAVLRKLVPPPALCGFLLLLALMFAVSYAVGVAAGPVAPGMHGTGTSRGGGDSGGGGGTDDMGDMHGGGH